MWNHTNTPANLICACAPEKTWLYTFMRLAWNIYVKSFWHCYPARSSHMLRSKVFRSTHKKANFLCGGLLVFSSLTVCLFLDELFEILQLWSSFTLFVTYPFFWVALQSFLAGLAASGALTSGLRLITKAAFENSQDGLRKGASMCTAFLSSAHWI